MRIFLHYSGFLITFSLSSHQRYHLRCLLFSCHRLQHVFSSAIFSILLGTRQISKFDFDTLAFLFIGHSMGMISVWYLILLSLV